MQLENTQIQTRRRAFGDMTIDPLDVWNACIASLMSPGQANPSLLELI